MRTSAAVRRTLAALSAAPLFVTPAIAAGQTTSERAASIYFGQPVPGLVPERFAAGIVSTDAIELNGVFSPDFREFFFARLIEGVQTIHHAVLDNGEWTAPHPLLLFPGGTRAVADDPW